MEGIEGGCMYVFIGPGDTIFIPPDFFHFVQTVDDTVAVGTNFLMISQMHRAVESYLRERKNQIPRDNCFPQFEAVVIALLINAYRKRVNMFWARARMLKSAMNAIYKHSDEAIAQFAEMVRLLRLLRA
jgi:hypothetical protein